MGTARLRPCPTCGRHARVSEEACPFCGQRFDDAFRSPPTLQAPTRRLTRAAIFALGSGTAALAPGCSTGTTSFAKVDTGNVAPPYGAVPPLEDATVGPAIDSDVSACVAAGGECSASTCAFIISASCGPAGGSCCVPCEADPEVARILASKYDQTCTVNSDCVAVGVGDPCRPCDILCGSNAAINTSSLAQYRRDVADSPGIGDAAACRCTPTTVSVCCNAGTCDPSCGVEGSGGAVVSVHEAGVDEAGADDASAEDAGADDAGVVDAGGAPD
jgi:hypothetical protein